MHKESLDAMETYIHNLFRYGSGFNAIDPYNVSIIDFGSRKVGKQPTYKDIIPIGIDYIGVDLVEGNNVDTVCYPGWELKYYNYFDLAISGQMLEHTPNPIQTIRCMYKVLRIGGRVAIIAPSAGHPHCRPDYWRILPDGMERLLKDGGFTNVGIRPLNEKPWYSIMGTGIKGEIPQPE